VIRRSLLPIAVTALQVAAAILVLGVPHPGDVIGFLVGSVPTLGQAVATLQALLWTVVGGSALVGLGLGLRQARLAARVRRLRHAWAGAVVVAGCCVLLAGVAHRLATPTVTMTGGSVQEARQELAR
jgi:hypothetical protein